MTWVTKPVFIQPLPEGIAPGMRTWLTVRNDDIYTFRFSNPAYAREYILNMPPTNKFAGIYPGRSLDVQVLHDFAKDKGRVFVVVARVSSDDMLYFMDNPSVTAR